MIELKIKSEEKDRLITNKGVYRICNDRVVSVETGEAFEVAGSETDENGHLCQLMIEYL